MFGNNFYWKYRSKMGIIRVSYGVILFERDSKSESLFLLFIPALSR